MNAIGPADLELMKAKVPEVAEQMRMIATPTRLLLLCQLAQGEASVGELEKALGIRQPGLSQQLAELRQANLVATRRQSRSIFYRIADPRVGQLLTAMHAIFCGDGMAPATAPDAEPVAPAPHGAMRLARVTR